MIYDIILLKKYIEEALSMPLAHVHAYTTNIMQKAPKSMQFACQN